MKPITRKELYLNKIVGNNDYETPEKPITIEEFFFAAILGEAVQAPEPLTRYQIYLAKIAGKNIEIPYPKTRLEYFLAKAAGMDITVPVPITREEIYWSNYTAIVEFEVENVPPLTYKAIEGTLKNYRIYGNTVDGESVGNLVESGEHSGEYIVPVKIEGKNLLQNTVTSQTINGVTFTVNSDGSVTCNGTANNTILYEIHRFPRFSGKCILSGCPINGSKNTCRLQYTNMSNMAYQEYGTGVDIYQFDETQYSNSRINIRIENGYTCDNLTFYPMIRKASIEDDTYEPYQPPITTNLYLTGQIRKVGDEAEYIDFKAQKQYFADGTSVDVGLLALPTIAGTNVLTVGTEVQPSNVYIKYKGAR